MRTNYMGFAEVRGRIALKLMTLGKDLEGEGVYRSMQEEEKKKTTHQPDIPLHQAWPLLLSNRV